MGSNNPPDILQPVTVAMQRLGIGRTKFYSLAKAGKIPLVHLGLRCVRVRQSDLDRLIANGLA